MAEPTGECWCGCGARTSRGSFFASDGGHDARALHAALGLVYGAHDTTAQLLEEHDFQPGGQRADELRRAIQKRYGA